MKYFIYISLVIFILIFSSINQVYGQFLSKNSNKQLNEADLVNLNRSFINANKEKIIGNIEEAVKLFLKCIEIDKNNDASYYELAQIYAANGNIHEALKFVKNAVAITPNNEWYQLLYAEILEIGYNYKEAAKVYENLIKLYPENIGYYLDCAAMNIYANEINKALKIYEEIEKKIGITEDVSLQKVEIFLRIKKCTKAINELENLIVINPYEIKYYGQLAKLYIDNKENTKAIEMYKKIQFLAPENPNIHFLLADYYRTAGKKDSSFYELKLAFENADVNIDTKIKVLFSFLTVIKTDSLLKQQAFDLAEIMSKIHNDEAKTFALYGDLLYNDNKLDEARQKYRKAIELDNEKFLVWQQLLIINTELNDITSLLYDSDTALTLFPNQPIVYFFNGTAKLRSGKYEETIEITKAGLNITFDNPTLISQLYANLGEAYYRIKKNNASDSAYDQSLNFDPNNIYVLNNYSYYLSLRNENLDKAEQLSYKANLIESNNSSFQDTYGWIMYKKGNLDEAQKWIIKAMENGGEKSPVINEHLGDTLFKLGKTEDALKFWQKAKSVGSENEILDKKIINKKLYE